jgi:hypothetical protein
MIAAPLRPLGPFARAAREALEGAAPHERARAALLDALAQASLVTVPEDLEGFRAFVLGALDLTVRRMLGVAAAELVRDRLAHVLWMATTSPSPRRASGADEDDASGEHRVESTGRARSSGISPRIPSDAAMQAVREVHEAKTQPPPAPPAPSRGSAPRPVPRAAVTQSVAAPLAVLVVTLDASLAQSMRSTLGGRAHVTVITCVADLARATAAARARVSVVVDVALSSIDMPTFASLTTALPVGSRVVLWGTNERQKARLAASFPNARDWIASPGIEPAAEVLGR